MSENRKQRSIFFYEDEWELLAKAAKIAKGRTDKLGEFVREIALLEAEKVIEKHEKG